MKLNTLEFSENKKNSVVPGEEWHGDNHLWREFEAALNHQNGRQIEGQCLRIPTFLYKERDTKPFG